MASKILTVENFVSRDNIPVRIRRKWKKKDEFIVKVIGYWKYKLQDWDECIYMDVKKFYFV